MDKQLEERIKARLAQRVRAKKNLNAGRKWNDDGGSASASAPAPAATASTAAGKTGLAVSAPNTVVACTRLSQHEIIIVFGCWPSFASFSYLVLFSLNPVSRHL